MAHEVFDKGWKSGCSGCTCGALYSGKNHAERAAAHAADPSDVAWLTGVLKAESEYEVSA